MKALSLFANVGVAEAYLKDIGLDVVVANELEEKRADFYSHLYPECDMVCGDITDEEIYRNIIKKAKKQNVEFILATPPCQGMSIAGHNSPYDERNSLVKYAVDAIIDINIVQAIRDFLTSAWDTIKTTAETVWNAIKGFFVGLWEGIKTIFSTVLEAIKLVITTYINFYKTIITTVFNAIKTVITTVLNAIKTVITTVWNGIKTTVSTVVNAIKTTITTVFNNILTEIKTVVGNIAGAIKSGFETAINFITSLPSKALQWGKDMIMGIVNGIKSCISAVGDAVKSVADKITSFLHFSVPDEGPLLVILNLS